MGNNSSFVATTLRSSINTNLKRKHKMSNTNKTFIVWNGCDQHEVCDENKVVWTTREYFTPFEVQSVKESEIPKDADGELDFDGIFLTLAANGFDFWKAV